MDKSIDPDLMPMSAPVNPYDGLSQDDMRAVAQHNQQMQDAATREDILAIASLVNDVGTNLTRVQKSVDPGSTDLARRSVVRLDKENILGHLKDTTVYKTQVTAPQNMPQQTHIPAPTHYTPPPPVPAVPSEVTINFGVSLPSSIIEPLKLKMNGINNLITLLQESEKRGEDIDSILALLISLINNSSDEQKYRISVFGSEKTEAREMTDLLELVSYMASNFEQGVDDITIRRYESKDKK